LAEFPVRGPDHFAPYLAKAESCARRPKSETSLSLATSAAEGGAAELSIMEQSRHRSLTLTREYMRRGSLFRENAAARSGL
jgi:hypothetical protein